jgi:hypothetical protein
MQALSLPAVGRKKLNPLTYDNPLAAPAGTSAPPGLKNNKKMMLVPSLTSISALSFSAIVTDAQPEPAS